MPKAIVVYASKYGSTREVAAAIADGLSADLLEVGRPANLGHYDLVVLGSPLYCNNFLDSMNDFLKAHRQVLQGKKVAAFVLGATELEVDNGLTGDEDHSRYTQDEWAEGLGRSAGGELIAARGFGGRMVAEQLDHRDRGMLEWFYRYLMHKPLVGFDQLDLEQARAWGRALAKLA